MLKILHYYFMLSFSTAIVLSFLELVGAGDFPLTRVWMFWLVPAIGCWLYAGGILLSRWLDRYDYR